MKKNDIKTVTLRTEKNVYPENSKTSSSSMKQQYPGSEISLFVEMTDA